MKNLPLLRYFTFYSLIAFMFTGVSLNVAIDELIKFKGIQFDPIIVEAFLEFHIKE